MYYFPVRFSKIPALALSLACFSQISFAADTAEAQKVNSNVLPEASYPYWPSYHLTPLDDIQPQAWRDSDDIIDGWDWSLPPDVKPSESSLMGLQRIMGLKRPFQPMHPKFPVNAAAILWVAWRDIEPREGEYRFDLVKDRIKQANEAGCQVMLRILTSSRSRGKGAKALEKGHAPLWLDKYHVALLPKDPRADSSHNYDPADPEFHKHYLKLIDALAKSGIPQMVRTAYVGYASNALGDEGIGPEPDPDSHQHVRERLDAWARAFKGMERKVFMGGPSLYGMSKGFGVRRGFVEMYLYEIPAPEIGQYVDENGYLIVDENAPVIRSGGFHGEVNEEFEPAWATKERGFRYGATTNSFPYRYFTSNLRALQMRCNYIHLAQYLIPEMVPFISLELGRTAKDTPDVWCFLRESYLRPSYYAKSDDRARKLQPGEKKNGIPVKNFERWLHQRDSEGSETQPAIPIQQPIKMWMVQGPHYDDYIARKGKRIAFDIDDRWLAGKPHNVAVKVTYFDQGSGSLEIKCPTASGEAVRKIPLGNTGKLRTATFFIDGMIAKSGDDVVIEGKGQDAVVSFVRIVKLGA